MRDILFRALTNNNIMVYGYYVYDEHLKLHYIDTGKGVKIEINPDTLGQFTGMYDATTWDELTEVEKKAFYEQNNSEDGERIKYQKVEDVKYLWKGRKIYEGDVVSLETYTEHEPMNEYTGEILIGIYGVGILGVDATAKEDCYYYGDICGYINEWKVIGNLYQNPELIDKEMQK